MKKIRWSDFSLVSKIMIEVGVLAVLLFSINMLFYARINNSMQEMDDVYASNAQITELGQVFDDVQDSMYQYLKVKNSQALMDYYQNEAKYRQELEELNEQNIDDSVYEASYIDGATPFQQFMKITIPLLKPTILLTAIMSTSGTLQLFDESVNLTSGGPGKSTMTLAHYVYNISFVETPKFNYAAAISVFILVSVAVLSAIQMKVGDKRD